MFLDDHPKFTEWVAALDRLKAATDVLQFALSNKEGAREVAAARGDVRVARALFDKVSLDIPH